MANKATQVETKEELKASAITRCKEKVEAAQGKLSKANVDKLNASIAIGKAFIDVKHVFESKEAFGEWTEITFGIKVSHAYGLITLADPQWKDIITEAKAEKLGPTDAGKKIADAKRAAKGKSTKEPKEIEYNYTLKRATSDLEKPGDGDNDEVVEQLFAACRSVLEKHADGITIKALLVKQLRELVIVSEEKEEATAA